MLTWNVDKLIRISFSNLDGPLFKKIFTALVRPHLEYGLVISSPYLKTYFIVKNVQRHTAKLVDGYKSLKYTERLKRLDLSSHWDVQALSQLRHN